MYNYPKPPPSVSSGFAVEKGGPSQEGKWWEGQKSECFLCVSASHWLGYSFLGVEALFQSPGVQMVIFPLPTYPIS